LKAKVLAGILLVVPLTGASQSATDSSLRLYVLDGGTLINPDPSWANVTIDEVKGFTSIPVPAFLVVHSDGVLLWDTGLGDYRVGRSVEETGQGSWSSLVTTTIRGQLAEVGYSPSEIDYLALSHTHWDHTENANDYASSTWLVQQAELDWVDFADAEEWGSISELEDSEKIVLSGDHDVFGDATVIIKSTPGHTPGHQSLYLDLADTGPIVLSGDLYHLDAQRRLNRIRDFDFDGEQTATSRAAMERFLDQSGAQLWIQHELMDWATLKKTPAYYE
jgi:glyoxylase-like metal-dependent hydrolase (beta-lactamase superfamily II)